MRKALRCCLILVALGASGGGVAWAWELGIVEPPDPNRAELVFLGTVETRWPVILGSPPPVGCATGWVPYLPFERVSFRVLHTWKGVEELHRTVLRVSRGCPARIEVGKTYRIHASSSPDWSEGGLYVQQCMPTEAERGSRSDSWGTAAGPWARWPVWEPMAGESWTARLARRALALEDLGVSVVLNQLWEGWWWPGSFVALPGLLCSALMLLELTVLARILWLAVRRRWLEAARLLVLGLILNLLILAALGGVLGLLNPGYHRLLGPMLQ